MPAWIVTLIMLSVAAMAPGTASAAEKTIGRSLGEAGRAIVDDSKSAYQNSRDFFVDTGQSVSQDAREAYENAKHIGPRMAEDLKDGFQGSGQAPDPTKAAAPATEKP